MRVSGPGRASYTPNVRWVAVAPFFAGLVLAGCSGGDETPHATELKITVEGFTASLQQQDTIYTLRCDPPGGNLPRAAAVCGAISQHRALFLDPPLRGTCIGGLGVPPSISMAGRYRGREVETGGRSCDWPGGLAMAVIQAAHSKLNSGRFRQVLARLRCGEDPRLLGRMYSWRRRQACLDDPRGWGG